MSKEKIGKYFGNAIAFFIVILVGSSVAKEINKQLPAELKINFKKIFLEALFFALVIGILTYFILRFGGIC